MLALELENTKLALNENRAVPQPEPGWARIRVLQAGICRTDLELVQGYMGFKGVLGHEFVGCVEACEAESWIGKRVVGEINAACGACDWCLDGLGRHCPNRTVLGILGLDGCFAECCTLPIGNLHVVPDTIPDETAVFTEPLAAAYEILDQVEFSGFERCLVLGDGKLGILCAWVLSTVVSDLTLVGRHREKLERAAWGKVRTAVAGDTIEGNADLVVDATGRGAGLASAIQLCRPRGTLVLKSTVAEQGALNLAPIVINELTVVGSRCGRFEAALSGLLTHHYPVERLIDGRYPLARAEEAFEHAGRSGVLKILVAPA